MRHDKLKPMYVVKRPSVVYTCCENYHQTQPFLKSQSIKSCILSIPFSFQLELILVQITVENLKFLKTFAPALQFLFQI